MSEDLLGFKAGVNFYAYVGNNPLNFNDPMGLDSLDVNLGFIGGTIGRDFESGQLFWNFRAGLTGLGAVYDPTAGAPLNGNTIPGECTYCSVTSVNWETVNVSAGASIGPLTWSPFQVNSDVRVDQNFYDQNVGSYVVPGDGANFDLTNLTSVFDPSSNGKFGLNVSLDANYEWGGTVEWSSVRDFFGMEPLSYSPSSAANGDFVLYPNKINTNISSGVYSK